jgi:uncharacterized membrane protein YeaQ/YmgE (transglycosylase-associated protein family)
VKETAQQVLDYLGGSILVSLAVAFVAGWAASKTVASEWRSGVILWLFVGVAGLFLSQFVLLFSGLQDYIEGISEFRILFDLIAAYVASFFIAALIHFVRPL